VEERLAAYEEKVWAAAPMGRVGAKVEKVEEVVA
jgi:hypothetical protein